MTKSTLISTYAATLLGGTLLFTSTTALATRECIDEIARECSLLHIREGG